MMDITGLVFLILLARRIFPDSLKDGSPTGAAWVAGRTRDIIAGLFAGVIFAALFIFLSNVLEGKSPLTMHWMILFTKESGYFSIVSVMTMIQIIIIAPVFEELMIRGILYAGFNKSFGLYWSFILIIIFNVFMHGDRLASLPYLITLLCISTFSLLFRLKTRALGPLIAMHIAHNAATVFFK
jgi:membrane protease YdiL (CAAX protease family)